MAIDKKNNIPEDYNETKPGRFLARMVKNKNGMYKDEERNYKDGRKSLVVFPYTKRRADRHDFREMNVNEISIHEKFIFGKESKPSYAMLERKIHDLEEQERIREELIKKRKAELEKQKNTVSKEKALAQSVKK